MKRSKRKITRVITTRKSYSGEQSPYWDFLQKTQLSDAKTGSGEFSEPVEANPDALPEDATLWSRELSDEAQFRLDIIQEGMALLSEQQRRIVYYCGIKGMSLEKVAKKLGIQKGTAQKLLERARTKIEKLYKSRKTQLEI